MSLPIISVEGLSKRFIISHEGTERYTALRDVVTKKAKGLLQRQGKSTQVTKEEFWALKDVNFSINQGDRIGIVGRNGAGKSTLLKILSRITEPTQGKITIRGSMASLLEVGTGFHPELTGRENIFLNGAILGMGRAEIRKKFDEIVSFAEVERFLDTPVKRYSSGMYVRLAFAVAAHLESDILIIDEVLAVGDAQFQKKCLGKMEDVSKNEGRTLLFVSHNMGVISNLCTKGILLNKGAIELQGDIQNVVNAYISNSNHNTEFGYASDDLKTKKSNYFKKIYLQNSTEKSSSDFAFDESITINLTFVVNEPSPNLMLGIGIQDKYQNRVSTFVTNVDNFKRNGNGICSGTVTLPAGIIAPNLYSFVFVLWIKDVVEYEVLENVCNFKIHDNGSEFSVYEGYDYGSFIVYPKWKYD